MKKLLSLLLVLALLPFVIPNGAKGISDVSIKVTPAYRSDYGEYKINFITEADLIGGTDDIFLKFPLEANIPCTSCAYGHCPSCFKINGYNAARVGLVDASTKTIYITMPGGITVKKGEAVEVVISQGAAFQNPSKPGKYTLTLWTSKEGVKVEIPFEILSTKVKNVEVINNPQTGGMISEFTIKFTTGEKGNLSNGGYIYIELPSGVLPETLEKESVIINGVNPSEIMKNGATLALRLAQSLGANRSTEVFIEGSFGLKNPEKGGVYELFVSTDAEPEKVSGTFTVKEKDTVFTLLNVEPSSPDGSNGFYIMRPTVILTGETNTGEAVETFYKIDEGEFLTYKTPVEIEMGTHTLSYFSRTSTLTEPVQMKEFKVDTEPPEIFIEIPSKDPFYTYEDSIPFSGSVSESAQLIINGKSVTVDKDLSFTILIPLDVGENKITVKAIDAAGLSSYKTLTAVVDETIPVLTVLEPKEWQVINSRGINVKGSVYPVNSDVYIGNTQAVVKEDGTFELSYVPENPVSLFPVTVNAVYRITGKSVSKSITVVYKPEKEIILKIGSYIVTANGVENTMDVAPFIDRASGSTMVPVRFVTELLGGDVEWDEYQRIVTIKIEGLEIRLQIGKSTAMVNGKSVVLRTPPMIKDKRTFVPVRFVAETMGFEVEWRETTRSVVIRSP